jgi:deazaflavin-dependent oxidoreductase (nitroreductase family)
VEDAAVVAERFAVDQPLPVKPPTAIEAILNRVFGWLVGLGFAPAGFYLLEVRGRKTGRVYSTPVDVVVHRDRRFLVAPRGYTQWVRNAKASGTVTLRRGRVAERYLLREPEGRDKAEVLKAYLDTYKSQVQRFFPVPSSSSIDAFVPIADRYPAFELTAKP